MVKLALSLLIQFVLFLASTMTDARTETGSPSAEWCDPAKLYKPYLKYYYGGRTAAQENGKADKILSPGQHWDFRRHENTYICINGPAWLYYAKILHETGLTVLHRPELHMFRHDCMLTNYKKGSNQIDPKVDQRLLYSILLMGHEEDYRKPSLQLMPAPVPELVWDATKATGTGVNKLVTKDNYTIGNSVVIIGDDTECILLKGSTKIPIRIRSGKLTTADHLPDVANPDEVAEYQGTFCKFSYASLSNPVDDEVNLAPPLTEKDMKYTAESLKGYEDLVKQGCYVPEDYDTPGHRTTEIVEERIKALVALATLATNDTKNVLRPVKDYLTEAKGYIATFLAEKIHADGDLTVEGLILLTTGTDPCLLDFVEVAATPYTGYPPNDTGSCKPSTPAPDACFPCDPANEDKVKLFITLNLAIVEYENNRTIVKNANAPDAARIKAARDGITKAKMLLCLSKVYKLTTELGVVGSGAGAATGFYDETLKAWGTNADTATTLSVFGQLVGLKAARAASAAAPTDAALKQAVYVAKQQVAEAVSKAETSSHYLHDLMRATQHALGELDTAIKSIKGGGTPNCGSKPKQGTQPQQPSLPPKSGVITIKRVVKGEYLKLQTGPGQDSTMYPSITKKTCAELPKPKESCAGIAPDKVRSCQLLKARMGKFEVTSPTVGGAPPVVTIQNWEKQDEWRGDVLRLIAEIFVQSCNPMVKAEFALGINSLVKGYLMDFVKGTLPNVEVQVQKDLTCTPGNPDPCEMVTVECDPSIPAHLAALGGSATACPVSKIPPFRSYWDTIISTLEKCKLEDKKQLKFKLSYKNGDKSKPIYSFLNPANDGAEEVIEPNVEQADEEYSLNHGIDGLWKMFSTVLGICMPALEVDTPQITNQFYSYFSEDFLAPLAKEWRSERDNVVLDLIIGGYFGQKFWLGHCLESSFARAGDVGWRPPRKLLVNGKTEMNFYTKGPLTEAGKQKLVAYDSV